MPLRSPLLRQPQSAGRPPSARCSRPPRRPLPPGSFLRVSFSSPTRQVPPVPSGASPPSPFSTFAETDFCRNRLLQKDSLVLTAKRVQTLNVNSSTPPPPELLKKRDRFGKTPSLLHSTFPLSSRLFSTLLFSFLRVSSLGSSTLLWRRFSSLVRCPAAQSNRPKSLRLRALRQFRGGWQGARLGKKSQVAAGLEGLLFYTPFEPSLRRTRGAAAPKAAPPRLRPPLGDGPYWVVKHRLSRLGRFKRDFKVPSVARHPWATPAAALSRGSRFSAEPFLSECLWI